MSEAPIRGVVVAHADLARALVEAVQRIAGTDDEALVPVSNEGLGPDGIRARIDEAVGDGTAIVFTDLGQGSCGMAARRACRGRPERILVTGVNLPVLLDFVLKRGLPLPQLVEHVVDRGRTGIAAVAEPPLEEPVATPTETGG